MGRAKDIIVKVIPSKVANEFVKQYHYSGKVVQNSSLHFGAFLDGRLHGVMSFGSPLDKRKVLPLVHTAEGVPVPWNDMLELNRMAFDDVLPANSESRCISVAFRLLRKNAPHIKWVLSFSDGTQCGDGTIYRASGFALTGIKENASMWRHKETGERRQDMQFFHTGTIAEKKTGMWERVPGYQLRYIYILDKTCKITAPILPFSKIDALGAGMYKGEKVTLSSRKSKHAAVAQGSAPGNQSGGGVQSDPAAPFSADTEAFVTLDSPVTTP